MRVRRALARLCGRGRPRSKRGRLSRRPPIPFPLRSLRHRAIASNFSRVLRDFAKVHVRQAPKRAMDGSHSSLLSENCRCVPNFSPLARFCESPTFGKRRGGLWTVLIPRFSLFSLKIAIAPNFSRVLRDFAKVPRSASAGADYGRFSFLTSLFSLFSLKIAKVPRSASAGADYGRFSFLNFSLFSLKNRNFANLSNPRLDLFYE